MKILTPLFFMLIALGCSSQNSADSATTTTQTVENTKELVTAKQFKDLLDSNENAVLVDVRTAGEFKDGAISGALNIDYYNENFIAKCMELDTNKAIYIYCRSGGRSAAAALKLQEAGFTQIFELQGGIISWKKSSFPVVKEE